MLTSLKQKITAKLSEFTSLSEAEVLDLLEVPKNQEHGELSLPVFSLAKRFKKAPALIASDVKEKMSSSGISELQNVDSVAGFVNFKFDARYLQKILLDTTSKKNIGFTTVGVGKTVIIDYSSPNVAKPMSIGHLRATVIGQAIRNLAESQGYKVIGINHLGDWGVQFGKLAWAYTNWGKEYPFQEKPFESLFQLYVRFHEEAEKDKNLDAQGSAYFKRLEQGDAEIQKLWRLFLDISMQEYQRIYGLLNIHFDLIQGEAFYNDHLAPTEKRLKDAGILEESQGAQVVFIKDDMPPCIIRKSDGTSLYATRDIASAIYRREVLKGDKILYVVGVDQMLHFQQVFGVLKKMGYAWAEGCEHIAFGMYRFKDEGKMSTRRGRVIFMDDVLQRAIEIVRKRVEEKNPDLPNIEKIAQQVGVGAIVFNDLVNDRVKNVDFDWDRVLDFEGDSGPYVQYCSVRCSSILKKYGKEVEKKFEVTLDSPEERVLMRTLLLYEDTLKTAFSLYRPNVVAQYLLDLCRAFNHFYQKHRILDGEEALKISRLSLVLCTQDVINSGLKVLGMQAPEQM
ncbi:MAG: arginine--tRNA ligase [Bdellovibrionales bacterium]